MAVNKTQGTDASAEAFVEALPDAAVRADCRALMRMMHEVTGEPARMWGKSMVGFGRYHYRYASGHAGDMFLAGFAPRKQDLSIYFMDGLDQHAGHLNALGKHKAGKGCLYVKRLGDIDPAVLKEMIARSVNTLRDRYP